MRLPVKVLLPRPPAGFVGYSETEIRFGVELCAWTEGHAFMVTNLVSSSVWETQKEYYRIAFRRTAIERLREHV